MRPPKISLTDFTMDKKEEAFDAFDPFFSFGVWVIPMLQTDSLGGFFNGSFELLDLISSLR